jgi:hypothetical protein
MVRCSDLRICPPVSPECGLAILDNYLRGHILKISLTQISIARRAMHSFVNLGSKISGNSLALNVIEDMLVSM